MSSDSARKAAFKRVAPFIRRSVCLVKNFLTAVVGAFTDSVVRTSWCAHCVSHPRRLTHPCFRSSEGDARDQGSLGVVVCWNFGVKVMVKSPQSTSDLLTSKKTAGVRQQCGFLPLAPMKTQKGCSDARTVQHGSCRLLHLFFFFTSRLRQVSITYTSTHTARGTCLSPSERGKEVHPLISVKDPAISSVMACYTTVSYEILRNTSTTTVYGTCIKKKKKKEGDFLVPRKVRGEKQKSAAAAPECYVASHSRKTQRERRKLHNTPIHKVTI